MKRTKKPLALLLTLLAVAALLLPPRAAEAEGREVMFLALEENVLPVGSGGMPFWSGGYLYVPASIFASSLRGESGISAIINDDKRVAVLYEPGRSLYFEYDLNYAYDDATTYYPGAVLRGGSVYVPLSVVAQFFGKIYSVSKVSHGQLAWLRRADFGLDEKYFADIAGASMESRYQQYLQQFAAPAGSGSGSGAQTPAAPETPPEETPPEETPKGAEVFLTFTPEDDAGALLDVLQSYRAGAAFVVSPEWMEAETDSLRRIAAEGHSILIELTGPEDFEAGSEILIRENIPLTHLYYATDGYDAPEIPGCAALDGFALFREDLDSAVAAGDLMGVLTPGGRTRVLLLGDATASGLRQFLQLLNHDEGHALTLTESDLP